MYIMNDILQIIGASIIILIIIYISIYIMNRHLSYVSSFFSYYNDEKPTKEGFSDSSSTPNQFLTGVGLNSEQYNANIKSKTKQIMEHLILSKYRSNYEKIILNLHDYANAEMLNMVLNGGNPSSEADHIDLIKNIGHIQQGKEALNEILKFMDNN